MAVAKLPSKSRPRAERESRRNKIGVHLDAGTVGSVSTRWLLLLSILPTPDQGTVAGIVCGGNAICISFGRGSWGPRQQTKLCRIEMDEVELQHQTVRILTKDTNNINTINIEYRKREECTRHGYATVHHY